MTVGGVWSGLFRVVEVRGVISRLFGRWGRGGLSSGLTGHCGQGFDKLSQILKIFSESSLGLYPGGIFSSLSSPNLFTRSSGNSFKWVFTNFFACDNLRRTLGDFDSGLGIVLCNFESLVEVNQVEVNQASIM